MSASAGARAAIFAIALLLGLTGGAGRFAPARAQQLTEMLAAARYLPDGQLDPAFGAGGQVLMDIAPGRFRGAGQVIDGLDRITIAGTTAGAAGDIITLVRLTPDGALDPSFGDAGVVRTDLPTGSESSRAIAVDWAGRIIVAANACCVGEVSMFAVLRYLPSGAPDTTFSDDGVVFGTFSTTDFAHDRIHEARSLALDPFGRIVVAGLMVHGLNDQVGVARLTRGGRFDTTFHGDGRLVTDVFEGATAVTVDAQARITVAGPEFEPTRGLAYVVFMLLRLLPNGAADTSFGTQGVTFTDFPYTHQDTPRALALYGDRLIAAGDGFIVPFPPAPTASLFDVARYTATGAPDATFGTAGMKQTYTPEGRLVASSVKVDRAGRIVVGGQAYSDPAPRSVFAVARYLPSGAADTAFDSDGLVLTSFGYQLQEASGLGIDSQGRIIISGHVSPGG